MVVTFDVETNTINKGNPFTASGKMVSYSCKQEDLATSFNYYLEPDFLHEIRALFSAAKLIVGFNVKFDLHWMHRHSVIPRDSVRIWDCQIAQFILSGQTIRFPSLDDCCEIHNLPKKQDKVKEYWDVGLDTENIPQEILSEYNNLDVDITYQLYLKQRALMTPEQIQLCLIQGLDLLVLADMERNGVKFDLQKCEIRRKETEDKLAKISEELSKYVPTPHINLGSGHHLSCFLYGGKFEIDQPTYTTETYKSGARKGQEYIKTHHHYSVIECPPLCKPLPKTLTKLVSKVGDEQFPIYETNEDVLKQLKTNKKTKHIISLLLEMAEHSKLMDTYFGKLPALMETMEWGEWLHGQYNQCVVATGRLSSSNPNMQNFSGPVDELLISRYE